MSETEGYRAYTVEVQFTPGTDAAGTEEELRKAFSEADVLNATIDVSEATLLVVAPFRLMGAREAIAAGFQAAAWDVRRATLTYDEPDVGCDFEDEVYCFNREKGCKMLDHGPCSFEEPTAEASNGRMQFVELPQMPIGPYLALIGLETWNGAEVPYFTLEVVKEIADDLRALTEADDDIPAVEIVDGLVRVVSLRGTDDEFTEVIRPTRDGLFSVGGRAWMWESQHRSPS